MGTIRVRIEQEMYPDDFNPRDDENLGTMVCWHDRYDLGDEKPRDNVDDWMRQLAIDIDPSLENTIDYWENGGGWAMLSARDESKWKDGALKQSFAKVRAAIERVIDANVVMLSLYLYDHSGLTMNTAPFSCPWDSGQVGFIYITRKDIEKEYGWKVLTKARRKKIESYLKGEVATYDQYLRNDIWCYVVEEVSHCSECGGEHVDEIESCGGFFGDNPRENGMLENIPEEYEAALLAAWEAM